MKAEDPCVTKGENFTDGVIGPKVSIVRTCEGDVVQGLCILYPHFEACDAAIELRRLWRKTGIASTLFLTSHDEA